MWLHGVHVRIAHCHVALGTRLSVKQHGAGPCPRFAHQVAYDVKTKTIYMFGGHPGDSGKAHHTSMRLDDLWTMKVCSIDCLCVLVSTFNVFSWFVKTGAPS